MLRTVSIIPGIENFAPERTLTSNGSVGVAEGLAHLLLERLEVLLTSAASARRTSPSAR